MNTTNRREFLKTTALAGAGALLADRVPAADQQSPNDRVRFAAIGVGGKGDSDTADAARLGDLIAICDTDDVTLAAAAKKYPNAKKYNDYRKMLDEMGDAIDAVTVSIPDHSHAPAAARAMQMGKHCFCQKPLTHSIWEARRIGELARRHKVATQMGNQGTATPGLRKNAALIRAGVLGTVREVHVWTDRPIWPQDRERPKDTPPVPDTLHWDVWLGPAAERPYNPVYQPFKWRGWWDFGTGALGDMACHLMNMPHMALDLRDPTSVIAETSGHNQETYPKWSIIHYEFPATGKRPGLSMVWYDGGKIPPKDLFDGKQPEINGILVVGDKGSLYCPSATGEGHELLGGATEVDVKYPESPGHFEEWVRAIKGGEPAMSNFPDYATPLTETVLLGNLAVWADGKKIQWDAERLKTKNAPEVDDIIRPNHRKGWRV